MRLAADSFYLKLGSKTFVLRPSLRAAFDLNEKYDGFQNLMRHLTEGSLMAAIDLITYAVTDKSAWAAYGAEKNHALIPDLMAATDQLLEFVLVLTGANDKSDTPQTGKPITFEEFYTRLFEIGSGQLGWPPEVTWSSTPAEILAAHKGRRDLLQAIFGSGKEDQSSKSISDLRDDLNAIGDLTNFDV